MECREVKTLILEYADGELQPIEIKKVEAHLINCPACQKELAAYQESWEMLSQWQDIEPEHGYVSHFWTRISLEKSWHERFIEGFKEGLTKNKWAPVLVTACVILLVSVVSLRVFLKTPMENELMATLSEEEIEMLENVELAENYEILEELEFLEDMEIIENLDVLES